MTLANDDKKRKYFEKQALGHLDFLYFFALKLTKHRADAEDLVKEAFQKAYSHLDQLRDVEKWKPWLYAIMVNTWRNWTVVKGREFVPDTIDEWENSLDQHVYGHPQENHPDPETDLIGKEFWAMVESVLATANSHTNLTIVDQGALRVSHPNALGTTEGWTEIDNTASSRLELAGGITLLEQLNVSQKQNASGNVPCIVNVSGTNTLAGPILAGEGGSFWRFRVDADKLTVSGRFTNVTGSSPAAGRRLVLQGVGLGDWQSEIGDRLDPVSVTAVIKADDGTWILSGPNRYSGNTTISAGTLLVNGTLGTGTVTVNAGTLGGSGVISGPVVVPALGTLASGWDSTSPRRLPGSCSSH